MIPQDVYPAVVPYLTCGWPHEEGFLRSAEGVAAAGCPYFEVGFPFSDPIADGPTIQATSAEALSAGINLEKCFELTKQATERSGLPVVVMTYANLVYHLGLEEFCRRLKEVGGEGLIVPDLSLEESGPLREACTAQGLDLVSFVAPTTPPERRQAVAEQASGFLYLVAVRGVTGGHTKQTEELSTLISEVKQHSKSPVLVGFGVRAPKQVTELVGQGADGVIVGSALLENVRRNIKANRCLKATVRDFLAPMVEAGKSTVAKA